MSAFKLREAQGEDIPAILTLINSPTSSGKILKRSRKEVRKALRSFVVAEKGGQVVACGSLEIYNQKLAEIRSLVVDPSCRREGIATAIVERFIAAAKKKEIYEVLAITDRSNVFSPHGFSQQLHGQKALFLRP